MILTRTITTTESESEIRQRITKVFEILGYKQVDSEPLWVFRRGSVIGSFTSFSPKGWQVEARLEISAGSDQVTLVGVVVDINTTSQLVTDKERAYWDNEMTEIEAAILTGKVDMVPAARMAQTSLTQNLIAAVLIIGLMAALAVIGRMLFYSRFAMVAGGVVGLVLGFLIAYKWLNFEFPS